jgi:TonB dependent receptor
MQRGRHSLRVGGEIKRSIWRVDSANAASYGEIDFASFQDFLTGSTEFSFLGTGQAQVDFRATDYHLFVQDDWRASPKLTLNIGLRYELDLPPSETKGRVGGFDPGLYQPRMEVDGDGFPLGPPAQGIIIAGNAPSSIQLDGVTRVGRRIFKSVDPRDFAPRIGMAWSPLISGRLAIRGGYGIYYSRPSFLYLGLNFASPPFYQATTFFGASFSDPFPDAPPSSSFPRVEVGMPLSSPWSFLDRNNRNPYFQQFNASVQYAIMLDTVLQIAYVGSRGLRLYRQLNINQAHIASTDHPVVNEVTGETITSNSNDNAALRAPLQGVDPGAFSLNQSSGQSTYHSLQVTVNRQFSHGLQFAGAYTFSKSMDNTSGAGGGATSGGGLDLGNGLDTSFVLGNQVDPRANRAISDFDRTHRITFTFVWDLNPPKSWISSRLPQGLFAGWQLSGFVTAMSGLPVDIYDPAGGSLYGQIYGARPNWAAGANRSTLMNQVPSNYYFNPLSFTEAVVVPGQPIPSAHDSMAIASDFGTDYGNVGRNILRGPSQTNLDLSVMKSFRLREGKTLEFRSDFFNALNHASKSNPVSDISAAKLDPATGVIIDPGNFGRTLGSDSSPRIIQLSVKFSF